MKTVKLRRVGNSFGFTVPKEHRNIHLQEGGKPHIIEKNDSFTLTSFNPEFEK